MYAFTQLTYTDFFQKSLTYLSKRNHSMTCSVASVDVTKNTIHIVTWNVYLTEFSLPRRLVRFFRHIHVRRYSHNQNNYAGRPGTVAMLKIYVHNSPTYVLASVSPL